MRCAITWCARSTAAAAQFALCDCDEGGLDFDSTKRARADYLRSQRTSGTAYAQLPSCPPAREDKHYETDEKRKSVILTDEGRRENPKSFGHRHLYGSENIRTISTCCKRFRAHALFKRDKDSCCTKDGEVVI